MGLDNSTFLPAQVIGSTSFGIYDTDLQFLTAAAAMPAFVNKKLGGSILQVELLPADVFSSMEEAALEYGALVNSYQAKSALADLMGSQTGSYDAHGTVSGSVDGTQKFPNNSMAWAENEADAIAEHLGMGGSKRVYSGSVVLVANKQEYDFASLLSASNLHGEATGRVKIKKVFHTEPAAAYRFFNQTSYLNYLNNEFKFESFTPETAFYLLPIWEDVLRAGMLEMNQRVRRSNFSYDFFGENVVRIFPSPTANDNGRKLWVHYTVTPGPTSGANSEPYTTTNINTSRIDGVANIGNVPFGNISYNTINGIGRQWIRRYTVELCKEMLGQVRSKFTSIPIPNADVTLNGPDLVQEGRDMQSQLKDELKDLMEDTTYDKIIAREADKAQALEDVYKRTPLLIVMG